MAQPPPKETTMQLAEILSDLVSLRACDPKAALALVSARSSTSTSTSSSSAPHDPSPTTQLNTNDEQDPDLKRAKDLLKLHYEVKQAHARGHLSRGLEEARRGVEGAVGG